MKPKIFESISEEWLNIYSFQPDLIKKELFGYSEKISNMNFHYHAIGFKKDFNNEWNKFQAAVERGDLYKAIFKNKIILSKSKK